VSLRVPECNGNDYTTDICTVRTTTTRPCGPQQESIDMTETTHVLCFSDDETYLDGMVAPLEWSNPDIHVSRVASADAVVDALETTTVDTVVADHASMAAHPALFQAVRERRPDLSLLVLDPYESPGGDGTVIFDAVDFVDDITDPGSDDAFGGWVADSVVGTGDVGTPPGGTRPEDILRDVKRRLVDATDPIDVEEAVCDQLTLGGRYAFAWVGEYDRGERQVVPWVTDSATGDWPTSRTFPVGTGVETLIERALRTRELQVVDDISRRPDEVPWSEVSLERDVTGVAIVPLVADDELFGVMGVHTEKPDGFSDMERNALREIGESLSRVLHSMALRGRVDQQERQLNRYERLVETVGDGMYVLDEDGHFTTVNNGLVEMTGYSREGMLGEHVSLIVDEEGLERGREHIREMVAEGVSGPRTVESKVRRKDGTEFPCETKAALLPPDEDGCFRGTVGVIRDITERKKRERELERQNERLEAFASIVSHDLRNPLGVAQGYLDLALDTESTDQLDQVVTALDRMEDIIDDVLALAREGKTVTETQPVSLESVARDAWATVETGDATLAVPDSVTFEGDRSRVLRAFENLFRNAIEHGTTAATPERVDDLTVRVGVTDDDDGLGFYVADDGQGIPRQVRENMFSQAFTTSDEGLGLGLWVVQEVANAHGWRVAARASEDGGARFEFGNVEKA
jgi:PAS domain S-box-containing protein